MINTRTPPVVAHNWTILQFHSFASRFTNKCSCMWKRSLTKTFADFKVGEYKHNRTHKHSFRKKTMQTTKPIQVQWVVVRSVFWNHVYGPRYASFAYKNTYFPHSFVFRAICRNVQKSLNFRNFVKATIFRNCPKIMCFGKFFINSSIFKITLHQFIKKFINSSIHQITHLHFFINSSILFINSSIHQIAQLNFFHQFINSSITQLNFFINSSIHQVAYKSLPRTPPRNAVVQEEIDTEP